MQPPHDTSRRLRASLSIAKRDLLEFIRDRRTLFITLLLPMVTYPIVALASAIGVRTALVDQETRRLPVPIAVVVSGADSQEFASGIEDFRHRPARDQQGGQSAWPAEIDWKIATLETAPHFLDSREVDLWVDLPDGFLAALKQQGTVSLRVHLPAPPLRPRARQQFVALMRSLAEEVRQNRVIEAGLPLSILEPIRLLFPGQSSGGGAVVVPTESLVPQVSGAVLVLLAVLTMTGAFYPAIDAIAGEKERGTIETLLIAPCGANDIVRGKFLAIYAVTLATLAANVISIVLTAVVMLQFLPVHSAAPFGNVLLAAGVTIVAFCGLASLASATCLAVTTASRSVKEAQNTLTPVILLVSALAGVSLMPGMRSDGLLTAVPFAGQVVVARSAIALSQGDSSVQLQTAGELVWPLLMTLLSSGCLSWLLLRGTAVMLTDEEILFRGPDAAGGFMSRPARRRVPSVIQGLIAVGIGLAAMWYSQGISPAALVWAIPFQQASAVLLPLVAMVAWQRVEVRQTFALFWPGRVAWSAFALGSNTKASEWWYGVGCVAGAALVGAALFVGGANALLAVKGTHVSPEMQDLSSQLHLLLKTSPWWLAWGLIAVLPAVCEELLFRGWLQSAFLGKRPSRQRMIVAVVAQAAVFALFHLIPERMPQIFVLGLVLGWLVLTTRSLLPAIACHLAHNSMPLLLFKMID